MAVSCIVIFQAASGQFFLFTVDDGRTDFSRAFLF